jgi:hypothetical protein
LTQDLIAKGAQSAQAMLLSQVYLKVIGMELIEICDQLEAHGLVDYQMGIWEEEILYGRWLSLFQRL